jgi:hypothetical protein
MEALQYLLERLAGTGADSDIEGLADYYYYYHHYYCYNHHDHRLEAGRLINPQYRQGNRYLINAAKRTEIPDVTP